MPQEILTSNIKRKADTNNSNLHVFFFIIDTWITMSLNPEAFKVSRQK